MRLPSIRQLDRAGSDAGPILDSYIRTLEQMIPADKSAKQAIQRALKRADNRWAEYFGSEVG